MTDSYAPFVIGGTLYEHELDIGDHLSRPKMAAPES